MNGAPSFANDGAPRLSDLGISRNEAYELRLLADHHDIVEQVIAESTDADPPTRAKVLRAIRAHRGIVRQTQPDTVERQVRRLVDAHGLLPVITAMLRVWDDRAEGDQ